MINEEKNIITTSESINELKRIVICQCMVCGEKFKGEEPKMCCSGYMCGCMGLPIDPIICSEECYNKLPFRTKK